MVTSLFQQQVTHEILCLPAPVKCRPPYHVTTGFKRHPCTDVDYYCRDAVCLDVPFLTYSPLCS